MSACAAREAAEPEITPNRIDAPLDGRLLHRGSTRLLTNQTVARSPLRPLDPRGYQVLFAKYVQDHLDGNARRVARLRTYICPTCGTPVENRATALKRLLDNKPDIACQDCEARIPLWDEIEQLLASDDLRSQVAALRAGSSSVLDNESRGRMLVGDVYSTVARAGQIAREVTIGDHGIDVEVEFKTDLGQASGRKVYLQLKSGDSHLRDRERDEHSRFPDPQTPPRRLLG